MIIKVNGKEQDVTQGTTVKALLDGQGVSPEKVVVEYNLQILTCDRWAATVLQENDGLEVLSFVGGG